MADVSRVVSPRTKKQISDTADHLRRILRLSPFARVQMMPLLEHVLPEVLDHYHFDVVPDSLMKGIEGTTDIVLPIIRLANQTYERLRRSDPDARFTAAHELGHLVFHSGAHVRYARRTKYDCSSDPEWQADRFADNFLVPIQAIVSGTAKPEAIASHFGVPIEVARRRSWAVQSIRKNKGSVK